MNSQVEICKNCPLVGFVGGKIPIEKGFGDRDSDQPIDPEILKKTDYYIEQHLRAHQEAFEERKRKIIEEIDQLRKELEQYDSK